MSDSNASLVVNETDLKFFNSLVLGALSSFNGDNELENIKKSLRQHRGDSQFILVTSGPRTGSTFLSSVLLNITGYNFSPMCHSFFKCEHDLYLPRMCISSRVNAISLQHMRATPGNIDLLNLFDIKPIIAVRNIYDVASSWFNLIGSGRDRDYDDRLDLHGYAAYWADTSTFDLDDETKLDLIVDLAIPWYVNFYVSWYSYCSRGRIEAKWVVYEDMMRDEVATVRDVMAFLDIESDITDAQIGELVMTHASTAPLKGVSGLGDERLSTAQKEKINRFMSYYPNVDFSRIVERR